MATAAERQSTVEAKIDAMFDWLQKIDKTLHGNGQPGLKTKLAIIERNQQECPARASAGVEFRRRRWEVIASVASPIIAAVAILVAVVTSRADCSVNSASTGKSTKYTGTLANATMDLDP